MFRRPNKRFELDEKTTEILYKLMEIRNNRQKKDKLTPDLIMRYLIAKETQLIRDDYPTMEEIKQRNITRNLRLRDQKANPVFYCPQVHMDIRNIMVCHISCPNGHMTECHYPYTCNSDYCQHYKHQEYFEQESYIIEENDDGF